MKQKIELRAGDGEIVLKPAAYAITNGALTRLEAQRIRRRWAELLAQSVAELPFTDVYPHEVSVR